MTAENVGNSGCPQRDSAEHEGYAEAHRSFRHIKYTPSPVRRVEIPKPDGGIRKLGIPTVTSYYTPPNDVL